MAKRKTRKSDSGGKKPSKGVPTVDSIQKTEINEAGFFKFFQLFIKILFLRDCYIDFKNIEVQLCSLRKN